MLKKLTNNDKGSTYIERTLMYIGIFFLGTFAIDLILLACTMVITNHQLNYIASKLQFQSGFVGSSAVGSQWKNQEFYEYIDAGMESVGIDGTTYTWKLGYIPNIKNSTTYSTLFKSTGMKSYEYITPNRKSTFGNVTDIANSNIYETSSIKLSFDYHYRFSGKAFYLLHSLTTMNLYSDFINEYVN